MTLIRKTIFICLLGIVSFQVLAQNGSYDLRNIITPSPTTASLGKYGEIPVSLYTGIPNISIPLYEIKDGPLNVPISLSYHAGGIKVEEVASAVGLGWTLNAGGVVGRQQRGIADEYGWFTSNIANILQNGTEGDIDQLKSNLEVGTQDGEPDIYYYNFSGQSGKFLFDQSGGLHNYPAKNVLISPMGGGFYGSGWKIVTEDGTVYEFNKEEIVTTINCNAGDADSKTAWYLSKITSSDGKRQITFDYESVGYSVAVFLGSTRYFPINGYGNCLSYAPSDCSGTNLFSTFRLKQINFSGGYVKFKYNNERLDLTNDKSLDQVEIYATGNVLIRSYDLTYSYFGIGTSTPDEKRLKLTSLTEKSGTNISKPPHVFTYEESIQLPHRMSLSVDHWGYYNGKYNTSYIASFDFINPFTNLPYYYCGADRNANPATMQAGILKKITYPTGGETEFTFETNTSSDQRISPITYNLPYNSTLNNQPYSSLTSPYETTSFTIPAQGADVTFSVSGLTNSNSFCNYEVNLHCYLIKDNNISSPYLEMTDGTNCFQRKLPAGVYKFRFTFDGCDIGSLSYSINLNCKIPILAEMGKRPVGGLRIKKIEDKPRYGETSIVRKYKYYSEIDTTLSSGMLINYPEYGYLLTAHYYAGEYPHGSCHFQEQCVYMVKQSKTNYPLASSQGSFVGYSDVIEDYGDNGQTHHHYNVYTNPNPPFPFAPLEYFEWKLGNELSTKFFTRKNGQLFLSKEITYAYDSKQMDIVKGYKIGKQFIVTGCGTSYIPNPPTLTAYNVIPQFWALSYMNERTYDQNDPLKFIDQETHYTYDPNHFQTTQVRSSVSNRDLVTKEETVINKKYAQDLSFDGSSLAGALQGIQKLKDLHVINVPVEEYSYVQKRNVSTNVLSDQRITGGMITTFKTDNPYPDKLYQLKLDQSLALSTFNSYTASQKGQLYDSRVDFLAYDSKGNLLTQQKKADGPVTYLWGYDKKYPVAEVKNATNASTTISVPFTNSANATITDYINSVTPILPAFEILTGQQISGTVGLIGTGTNLPASPLVALTLKRANGTIAWEIQGNWGQQNYNISLTPGTYQWYISTGDVSFSPPYLTSIYVSISNTYSATKTGSRIFHTSFEEEGNHTAAVYTGKKSWSGSYTVYLPAQNGSYKLTYMKLNGSNWELKTYPVSVTSGTVQPYVINDGVIDEVRLYPADALMTTYTYDLLKGMTSSADENCVKTGYEYDSFGRLSLIRDAKNNIVKSFNYNYKQ